MPIRSFAGITPNIHPSAFIDETAVIIGDVSIGRDSSIWPQTVIRGDINKITIGETTNIQDGSVLHVTHAGKFNPDGAALSIGNRVIIGHHVTLHACLLEDSCLIGMGAIVMDKAIVRRQTMVAAGAVVGPGKDLESGYLWLGNPIRRGRELTDKEIAFLDYSADYYAALKEKHKEMIA